MTNKRIIILLLYVYTDLISYINFSPLFTLTLTPTSLTTLSARKEIGGILCCNLLFPL